MQSQKKPGIALQKSQSNNFENFIGGRQQPYEDWIPWCERFLS